MHATTTGRLRFLMLTVLMALAFAADAAQLSSVSPAAPAVPPDLLLRGGQYVELDARMSEVQRRYEQGAISEAELRDDFHAFPRPDPALAASLDAWVQKFPNSYVAHLARGIYYKRVAWTADPDELDTSPSQASMEASKRAVTDLQLSATLTRKPLLTFYHLLDSTAPRVDRETARIALDRAVRIDPATFIVRDKYMDSLRVRNGGSLDAMRAFLEECRTSKLSVDHVQDLESRLFQEEGSIAEKQGDRATAEVDFRRAVALRHDDCDSCADLANLLTGQKRFVEAVVVWSKALTSEPHNTSLRLNRAYAYIEIGKVKEAIDDWTVAADDGDADSNNKLAVIYMQGIPGLVSIDRELGINYFRRAATLGDRNAQHNLDVALHAYPEYCLKDECPWRKQI
jgi:tetratricopeptide (TPR) repeat protein